MFHYSDKVLDHFRNPRHWGSLEPHHQAIVKVEAGNSQSGKTMTFYIAHEAKNIIAVGYHVYGCVSTIATASMLSELLLNTPIEDLANMHATELFEWFELSDDRFNCALLAEIIIQKTLAALNVQNTPPSKSE